MLWFVDIKRFMSHIICFVDDSTIVCISIPCPIFAGFSFSIHIHICSASSRTFFPAFHGKEILVITLIYPYWKSLTRTLHLGTIGERRLNSASSLSWYRTWIIVELVWAFVTEGFTLQGPYSRSSVSPCPVAAALPLPAQPRAILPSVHTSSLLRSMSTQA